MQFPALVVAGNAAEIYRKTGIHTTKANLIHLKDDVLARKETYDLLKERLHGELLFRLRNGKDCTDILATSELAGAVASPHRELARALARVDHIQRQRLQFKDDATAGQETATVLVAADLAAVREGPLPQHLPSGLLLPAGGEEQEEEGRRDEGEEGGQLHQGGRGDPGLLNVDDDYGDQDMGGGYDEGAVDFAEERRVLVVAGGEVGDSSRRRGRPTKTLSEEETREKKRKKAEGDSKRKAAKKVELAALPTPERMRTQAEERLKDAARKRESRGTNKST